MFFYFAVDTVDNWKNINMSIKNFKSTIRWLSDAAVDAVDIKKLICQQIFFFYFYGWHHWLLCGYSIFCHISRHKFKFPRLRILPAKSNPKHNGLLLLCCSLLSRWEQHQQQCPEITPLTSQFFFSTLPLTVDIWKKRMFQRRTKEAMLDGSLMLPLTLLTSWFDS